MRSINDLPPEILTIIFSHFIQSEGHKSFLWNVAAVCKNWNELSLTAPIWKDVYVRGWKTEELLKLCYKGLLTLTQSLRLDDCFVLRLNVYDFSRIIVHCENLRLLDLHYVKLSEFSLRDLAKACPHLDSLKIDDVMSHGEDSLFGAFPVPLDLFGKGCPRLRTLELSSCAITFSNADVGNRWFPEIKSFCAKYCDFQGRDFHTLLKHSGYLKKLTIKGCKNIVLDDMSMISSDKLETLIIENMSFECLKFLEDAVDKWKRTLKVIRLCGLRRDLTSVLQSLLNENPHPVVESLCLFDAAVSDKCLVNIIRACGDLMHLNLVPYRSINKLPLDELEISCAKLRKLKLRGFKIIFSSSKDNYKFQHMKTLKVFECDFGGRDLHTLLSCSADLEKLWIRNCSNIEFNCMSMIASNKLQVLKIEDTSCGSSFKFLEDALAKCKRTLKVLHLCDLKHDITSVMESFLYENHHPVIESLCLRHLLVNIRVMHTLRKACKNLDLEFDRTVVFSFGS